MNILLGEALKQFNAQVVLAGNTIQNTTSVINKINSWTPVAASDAIYAYADISTGFPIAGAFVNLIYYRRDVSLGIPLVKRATEFL